MSKFETRLDNLGVVHLTFPEERSRHTIEDARAIYEQRILLTPPNTKQLLMVDLRTNLSQIKRLRSLQNQK